MRPAAPVMNVPDLHEQRLIHLRTSARPSELGRSNYPGQGIIVHPHANFIPTAEDITRDR